RASNRCPSVASVTALPTHAMDVAESPLARRRKARRPGHAQPSRRRGRPSHRLRARSPGFLRDEDLREARQRRSRDGRRALAEEEGADDAARVHGAMHRYAPGGRWLLCRLHRPRPFFRGGGYPRMTVLIALNATADDMIAGGFATCFRHKFVS